MVAMKLFDKNVVVETTMLDALQGHILICIMPDGRVLEFDSEEGERYEYSSLEDCISKTNYNPKEDFDTLERSDFDQAVIDVIKDHFVEGTKFYIAVL